jgi:thioesterase domain-containing protein
VIGTAPEGLHVVEHGEPDAAGLPSVVLVHGSLDRGASFARVVRRLEGLHVVTYDRRGYHHSRDMALARSLGAHVADLVALVGAGPVVVVGHSYGAVIALYVGGMGAKGKNFYNELACRYGYEAEAAAIQDLYLSGKKKEAEALVPDELLELTTLCGPEGYVKERVAAFREAGVTHHQVTCVPRGEQRAADLIELVKGFAS